MNIEFHKGFAISYEEIIFRREGDKMKKVKTRTLDKEKALAKAKRFAREVQMVGGFK